MSERVRIPVPAHERQQAAAVLLAAAGDNPGVVFYDGLGGFVVPREVAEDAGLLERAGGSETTPETRSLIGAGYPHPDPDGGVAPSDHAPTQEQPDGGRTDRVAPVIGGAREHGDGQWHPKPGHAGAGGEVLNTDVTEMVTREHLVEGLEETRHDRASNITGATHHVPDERPLGESGPSVLESDSTGAATVPSPPAAPAEPAHMETVGGEEAAAAGEPDEGEAATEQGDEPVEDMTVDEVLAAVERGDLSRDEALAAERSRAKPRKGVLNALDPQ